MNILAIETSTAAGQVALLSAGELYQSSASEVSHSQSLLELVQYLLNQADLTVAQIDCIGVARGPGSFTGLRIGIAVAQGLSFSHGIPLVSVSSLAVLAATVSKKVSNWRHKPQWVLATIDARMQQIYAGWYLIDGELPKLHASEQVLSPNDIEQLEWPVSVLTPDQTNPGSAVIAGGASVYQHLLPRAINALWLQGEFAQLQPSAAALLHMSVKLFAAGKTLQATELEPAYIRNNVTS